MSALFDLLRTELEKRYAGHGLRIESGPQQQAIFPAAHAEVGDLVILDDEDELTVIYGNFTHRHYGAWNLPPDATERDIVEALLQDLSDLFADRLIMWGGHAEGGGIYHRGKEINSRQHTKWRPYVWSGPL